MQNELIVVLVLLMKSMGAYADDIAVAKISDIPMEIQHCLLLATPPENRSILKVALDKDCYDQFSDADKQQVIKILKNIEVNNFKSSPVMTL